MMTHQFLKFNTNSQICPYITINYESTSDFDAAETALRKIKSKPVGDNLLKSILYVSDREKRLTIISSKNVNHATSGYLNSDQIRRFGVPPDSKHELYRMTINHLGSVNYQGKPSEGISSVVLFNPNKMIGLDDLGHPIEMNIPDYNFISLAHEIIHALHAMNGTGLPRDSKPSHVYYKDTGIRKEEERAIGLGVYEREALTENKIRAEHGLRIRKSFFTRANPPIT